MTATESEKLSDMECKGDVKVNRRKEMDDSISNIDADANESSTAFFFSILLYCCSNGS